MAQRRNGHPLRQDRPKQPDGVVDVTNAAYSNYGLKRLMFDLAQQVGPTVLWFYMITLSGHKYQYTYLQKRDCPECFFLWTTGQHYAVVLHHFAFMIQITHSPLHS